MLKPGSGSSKYYHLKCHWRALTTSTASPTKTTISGIETAMTSVQDDNAMSVASSAQVPNAPPPTGPNTVVGEKLPTADEIGLRLMHSATFRTVGKSTPSGSVVAAQGKAHKFSFSSLKQRAGGQH